MIDNKTIRQVVINKALLPCTPGAEVTREASGSGSSDRAVFSCNLIKPLESLIFTLEPQQEGSGDPSPDNPRPISGESEIKFFTRYGDPSSYTIPLTVTVYGGYYDADTGELWKTHEFVELDELTWTYHAAGGQYTEFFDCYLPNDSIQGTSTVAFDGYCSIYKSIKSGNIATSGYDNNVMALAQGSRRFIVCDQRFHNKNDFVSGIDGVILVYPLATPVKIATIDPIVINTNKGTNEMWTRDDIPFTLEYKYMVGGSCEISKQFLPIFYPNGKGVNHNGSTF